MGFMFRLGKANQNYDLLVEWTSFNGLLNGSSTAATVDIRGHKLKGGGACFTLEYIVVKVF